MIHKFFTDPVQFNSTIKYLYSVQDAMKSMYLAKGIVFVQTPVDPTTLDYKLICHRDLDKRFIKLLSDTMRDRACPSIAESVRILDIAVKLIDLWIESLDDPEQKLLVSLPDAYEFMKYAKHFPHEMVREWLEQERMNCKKDFNRMKVLADDEALTGVQI